MSRSRNTGIALVLAGGLLAASQVFQFTPFLPALYLGVGLLVAGITVLRERRRLRVLSQEDVERNFHIATVRGHAERIDRESA